MHCGQRNETLFYILLPNKIRSIEYNRWDILIISGHNTLNLLALYYVSYDDVLLKCLTLLTLATY